MGIFRSVQIQIMARLGSKIIKYTAKISWPGPRKKEPMAVETEPYFPYSN